MFIRSVTIITREVLLANFCYETTKELKYVSYTAYSNLSSHLTKVHPEIHKEGATASEKGKICKPDARKFAAVVSEKLYPVELYVSP